MEAYCVHKAQTSVTAWSLHRLLFHIIYLFTLRVRVNPRVRTSPLGPLSRRSVIFGFLRHPSKIHAVHGASTGSPFRQELLPRGNRLRHRFERNVLICKGMFVFHQIKYFPYLKVDCIIVFLP